MSAPSPAFPYFEPPQSVSSSLRAVDLIGGCLENGVDRLLLDDGALPAEFFDLSSGIAGELVQKLINYRIRMAAVVPDPTAHSRSFQDFAREADRGSTFRFFPNREIALAWLAEGE